MLTPAEIQSREFLVSLRGYDRDEVHAFLEEVSALVGQLQEREEAPAAPPEEPAPPAPSGVPKEHFADVAAQTQRVLEAAYAAAEEIRSGAERHHDELVATAKREAADVLSELTAQRRHEEAGLAELAQRRQRYRDELAGLAGSLGGLVGELDAANPDAPADPDPGDAPAAPGEPPAAPKPAAAAPAKTAAPATATKAGAAAKAASDPEPRAAAAEPTGSDDGPAVDTVELDADLLEELDAAQATAEARNEEAQQELLADAEATSDPPATASRSTSSSQARRGRRS